MTTVPPRPVKPSRDFERPLDYDGPFSECRDGVWRPAKPGPTTALYGVESWLRRHGFPHIARLMAWWDELWLG